MLLVESENARVLRQMILDIVIDVVNQKTGGATKYINQRIEISLVRSCKKKIIVGIYRCIKRLCRYE